MTAGVMSTAARTIVANLIRRTPLRWACDYGWTALSRRQNAPMRGIGAFV